VDSKRKKSKAGAWPAIGLATGIVTHVASASPVAPLAERLGNAWMKYDGSVLSVSTGRARRDWKLTPVGLVTTSVKNEGTGKIWSDRSSQQCDWMIAQLIDKDSSAELISLTAEASDDEGFVSVEYQVR